MSSPRIFPQKFYAIKTETRLLFFSRTSNWQIGRNNVIYKYPHRHFVMLLEKSVKLILLFVYMTTTSAWANPGSKFGQNSKRKELYTLDI